MHTMTPYLINEETMKEFKGYKFNVKYRFTDIADFCYRVFEAHQLLFMFKNNYFYIVSEIPSQKILIVGISRYVL